MSTNQNDQADFEEALETARFFEKNVNVCTEYEDAWIFSNSRKKPGPCNPVVIMKNGDAVPMALYQRTKLINTFKIQKE